MEELLSAAEAAMATGEVQELLFDAGLLYKGIHWGITLHFEPMEGDSEEEPDELGLSFYLYNRYVATRFYPTRPSSATVLGC